MHEQVAAGRSPTLAEITQACSFASRGAARKHVQRLAEQASLNLLQGKRAASGPQLGAGSC